MLTRKLTFSQRPSLASHDARRVLFECNSKHGAIADLVSTHGSKGIPGLILLPKSS